MSSTMNKRGAILIAFSIVFAVLFTTFALAVPQTLNLHGKLSNSDSSALTGSQTINFSIYTAASGGTPLYSSSQSVVLDNNGIYNVLLSNVNIDSSQQYYLGIKVGSDSEMTPRITLASTPYAFRTNVSDNLENNVNYSASSLSLNGRLGIGTSTPVSALQIQAPAAHIVLNSTASSSRILLGDNNGSLKIFASPFLNTGAGFELYGNDVSGNFATGIPFAGLNYYLAGRNGSHYFGQQPKVGGAAGDMGIGLLINNTGYVGIGTFTPQQKLNVLGDANITGNLYVGNVNVALYAYNQTAAAANSVNTTSGWALSGNNLYLNNSANNVGIGTANPLGILHLNGSDPDFLFERSTFFRLHFTSTGGNPEIYAENTSAGHNALILQASSPGFVGIGTASPTTKLDVRGVINASGEVYAKNGTALSLYAYNQSSGLVTYSGNIAQDVNLKNSSGSSALYINSSSGLVSTFNDTAGTSDASLLIGTRVGAGSTIRYTGTAKFYADSNQSSLKISGGNGVGAGSAIELYADNTSGSFGSNIPLAGSLLLRVLNNGEFLVNTNDFGTNSLRLDRLGNLTIRGNITAPYFLGDGRYLTNVPTYNSTYASLNSSSFISSGNDIYNLNTGIVNISNVVVVNSTNVVIGGPNSFYAGYSESVLKQNVNIFGGLKITASGATNAFANSFRTGQVLLANVTGTDIIGLGQIGGFPGVGGRAYLRTFTQNDLAIGVNDTNSVFDTNKVYLYLNASSKKLGIGTTNPQQMLDVRGEGNFSGTVYVNNGTDLSLYSYNQTNAVNTTSYLNLSGGTLLPASNDYNLSLGGTAFGNPGRLNINGTVFISSSGEYNSAAWLNKTGISMEVPATGASNNQKLAFDIGSDSRGAGISLLHSGGGTDVMSFYTRDSQLSSIKDVLQIYRPGLGKDTAVYIGFNNNTNTWVTPSYLFQADVNASINSTLYIPGNGAVGIGTSTPQQLLNTNGGTVNISSDLVGKSNAGLGGWNYTMYAYNQTGSSLYNYNQTSAVNTTTPFNISGNNVFPYSSGSKIVVGANSSQLSQTPSHTLTLYGSNALNISVNPVTSGGAIYSTSGLTQFVVERYDFSKLMLEAGGVSSVRETTNRALWLGSNNNYTIAVPSGGGLFVSSGFHTAPTIPTGYTFVVNGTANISNNLFVDRTRVGIGRASPTTELDVAGRITSNDLNFTGNRVLIGSSANKNTNFGTQVVYIGSQQAGALMTGINNVVIGDSAGVNAVSGSGDTYIGAGAGGYNNGSNNAFLGYTAGYGDSQTSTPSSSTFVGVAAGRNSTSGSSTYIGYEAGRNATGQNVVAIGYQAGADNTANSKFIVKQGSINSVPLIQGDFASGNVGIGTTTAQQKLNVLGSANITGDLIGLNGFNYTMYAYNQTSTTMPSNATANVSFTPGTGINWQSATGIVNEGGNITFFTTQPSGAVKKSTLASGNSGATQFIIDGNNQGCQNPAYVTSGDLRSGFFVSSGRIRFCSTGSEVGTYENAGFKVGTFYTGSGGQGEVQAGLQVLYNSSESQSRVLMNLTTMRTSTSPGAIIARMNGTTAAATRKETASLILDNQGARAYNVWVKDANWSSTGMDLFIIDENGNTGIRTNQTKSYALNVNGSTNLAGNTSLANNNAVNFGSGTNGNASIYWDGSKLVIAVN